MIFSSNQKNNIIYFLKKENISLEIKMKIINIEVNEKFIKINYLITDSNNEYEYYVEMSD